MKLGTAALASKKHSERHSGQAATDIMIIITEAAVIRWVSNQTAAEVGVRTMI
jgi:hypothetical protein